MQGMPRLHLLSKNCMAHHTGRGVVDPFMSAEARYKHTAPAVQEHVIAILLPDHDNGRPFAAPWRWAHLSHLLKQRLFLLMPPGGVHNDEVMAGLLELIHALGCYHRWVCLCVGPVEGYLHLCGILLQLVKGACKQHGQHIQSRECSVTGKFLEAL